MGGMSIWARTWIPGFPPMCDQSTTRQSLGAER